MRQDLLYALRRLKKSPGFAIVAILSLALGIGATTAIFSILNGVLFRRLPFQDPDRIVALIRLGRLGYQHSQSPPNFQDFSTQSGVFQSTAAYTTENFNVTGMGQPLHVNAAVVSWNFFQVLGANPILGRAFEQQESVFGKHRVAILSYSFWNAHFNGDRSITGKTLNVDGHPYIIIGVASAAMNFPSHADVWRPLVLGPEELDPKQRGAHYIDVIGRLKDGITLEQAQKKAAAFAARLGQLYPRTEQGVSATVVPLRQDMVRNVRTALLILFGSVAFVLLIACVNVIHLLLGQILQREGELAVRTALGARRSHLIRQFIAESVLLTFIGGILGFLVAFWGQDALLSFAPGDIPRLAEVHIDWMVFGFAVFSALATGMLIGLLPALQAGKMDIGATLKLAGPGAISGHMRLRRVLIMTEVALAVILLAGAGLLIRSFLQLQKVDPGFRAENLLTFNLTLPDTKYDTSQKVNLLISKLVNGLKNHPEVNSAAAIFGIPFTTDFVGITSFEQIGKPEREENARGAIRIITEDYFKTMKIPLRRGRFLNANDTEKSTPVVIINEAAARMYWPNENPIGQKIRVHASVTERPGDVCEIVGIVSNVHYEALDLTPEAELYMPHAQQPVNVMTVVLRSSSGVSNAAALARAELKRLDPDLPAWGMASMNELIGQSIAKRRFLMTLLIAFAAVALVLAGLGLYGVLSYSVARRTKEIGLRLALGATRPDLFRLVFFEALIPVGAGIVTGLFGSLALTRLLSSQLYQVQPGDPLTFAVVLFVLIAVALVSTLWPFERAVRVSPMQVLRYE